MSTALEHIRHFDVVHILRRDIVPKWDPSILKLEYGEVALEYTEPQNDIPGALLEIRAGNTSGTSSWSEAKSFIPAFPITGTTPQEVTNERKNKILGFDASGKPVLLSSAPGALTTLSKRPNPEMDPSKDAGLYLEKVGDGYELGINNENWQILTTGAE